MAEITVRVCDVDQRPGETVRHYSVTVDGGTREMDLCDRHAGPFAPMGRRAAAQPAVKASPRPSSTGRRKVTTMAEIEASKKKK